LEQDQKDIVIGKLKDENSEFRQREKDYNLLHTQLLELEQNHRVLQDDKNQKELEAKEIEELHAKKSEQLQAEIRSAKIALEEKLNQLKRLEADFQSSQKIGEDKADEISHLRGEIASSNADNTNLLREKNRIEGELNGESERKKAADLEIDRLNQLNDNESYALQQAENKIKENDLELLRLKRNIDEVSDKITVEQASKKAKESDIDATLENNRDTQKELERLVFTNSAIEDENKALSLKIKDLELQLNSTNNRIDDIYAIIDNKEKELRATKAGLANVEDKTLEALEQAKKTKRDNELLQVLLDKYKNDVHEHKKLRESEISEKLEILEDKKKIEREVLHKEIEAKSAKMELEKIQKNKDVLLDEHYQLNKELGALKGHAEVLENQNFTIQKELDTFVSTDQKVREELDRKHRIDYIKEKNRDELMQSSIKLRDSKSPVRKSPFKSPFKH
jgi:hypothetical protein